MNTTGDELGKENLPHADNFLRKIGYIGDVQKNNLVLYTKMIFRCKHCTFDFDFPKRVIEVNIHLGFFRFYFFPRKKKLKAIDDFFKSQFSQYSFIVRFKRYAKR